MKKKSLFLAALLSLGASSSFAAMNIPLGVGSVDGTINQVADLSLSALNANYVYEVNCVLSDPTGDKMAAKLRVELANIDTTNEVNSNSFATFDGMPNQTHQVALSDTSSHTYTIGGMSPAPAMMATQKPSLRVTWLAGDDVSTPVSYNCSATPAVGK